MLNRLIRQLLFGVALAVLMGPYDLFGWLSAGLLIIAITTIPTGRFLFYAFGTKILGVVAMTMLWGGGIVFVMLWIVDPIYRLELSLWSRFAAFAIVTVILSALRWIRMGRLAATQGRAMSWRLWLFPRGSSARAESRFQQAYLRKATNVTLEEEFLVNLYAQGGGDSLFVRKGWAGRRAAARAAVWVNEMEMWLRQNPAATKEEQLAQSRKLLDRMRLTTKW